MEYCVECKTLRKHKNRGFVYALFWPTSKHFMKKRCVICNTKLIPQDVVKKVKKNL